MPPINDAELEDCARIFLEHGIGVVQVGLLLPVHQGPVFRGVPMKEMLAPAHFFAGDIEATQSGNDGDGQHEGTPPHERIEEQPDGERERDQHDGELRDFEHSVALGDDPGIIEIRCKLGCGDQPCEHQHWQREPPPRFMPTWIGRERTVRSGCGGIG